MSSLAKSLGAAAAALGSVVARTKKKKATTKKKLPMKKRSKQAPAGETLVSAPSALVRQPRNSIAIPSQVMSVPFECISNLVSSNGSSSVVFGSVTSTTSICDLNPSQATGGQFPFGISINLLSSAFQKFRLKSLSIVYSPHCPTSTAGGLVLAYSPDAWVSGGTYNYATLGSLKDNLPLASWQPGEMRVTSLDRDWKYIYESVTNTAAESRIDCAGTLLLSATVPPPVSTALGALSVRGVIEFTGLGAETYLTMMGRRGPPAPVAQQATSSSADSLPSTSSSSSCAASSSDEPHRPRTLTLADKAKRGFGTSTPMSTSISKHVCIGCDDCVMVDQHA